MTDHHGERPEGWWLASDGLWYPPKLPPPPGTRRRIIEMSVALGLWAVTFVAYMVEADAQNKARGDCALNDIVNRTRTYDYCSVPPFNWTIWLAIFASIATIAAVANRWQDKKRLA